jgi:putative aldouronate transport system permease protein
VSVPIKHKLRQAKTNFVLYLLIVPAFAYIVIFCYLPMYGAQIAFRDYRIGSGIVGSAWVGLKWFRTFFSSPRNQSIILNTVTIGIYSLLAGFPIPIIFALLLNQVRNLRYKKFIQVITYMPNFISIVVVVGMVSAFFSPNSGFINHLLERFTGQRLYYLGTPKYYYHLFVWSGIWQSFGWSSIIYMASLASVDPELHEAAMIDGANKLRRIWHIDIPSIMPVMVILLVLSAGNVMNVGFEKSFLMQNDLNIGVSEVISTYSYAIGITNQLYSYSSAIGLFNNIVNFAILLIVNYIARKITETSLW